MNDLISRQAALEKVRTMQTYKLSEGDDMILVDKAEVQTELMMLPSVQPEVLACGNGELVAKPEPQWIPVSERLPEKSANYLVTVRWYREDDIDINVYEYNAWHKEWNDGESCGQRVIAWMPLPEAYKPNK